MLFDSHLHLDQLSDENIQQTLGDSRLTGMLAVSTNLNSAKKLLNLKQTYPKKLYIAAGFHPEQQLPSLEEQKNYFNGLMNIIHRFLGLARWGCHIILNEKIRI